MGEHVVIASPALIEAATIAAGPEAANFPVANLFTAHPWERWRSAGLAGVHVEIDLGAAPSPGINFLAAVSHNMSGAATWRWRAAASQAALTASPAWDSTAVSPWPVTGRPAGYSHLDSYLWLGGPGGAGAQSHRWWRVDFSDAGNADGFIELGRIYVAAAWQPSRNVQYGWGAGWTDPSPRQRTLGGQLHAEELGRWRELRFQLRWLSEDEMYENAYELARTRGTSGDVIVVRNPAATKHLHRQSVYGVMRELAPIVNARHRLFETSYAIEEMPA